MQKPSHLQQLRLCRRDKSRMVQISRTCNSNFFKNSTGAGQSSSWQSHRAVFRRFIGSLPGTSFFLLIAPAALPPHTDVCLQGNRRNVTVIGAENFTQPEIKMSEARVHFPKSSNFNHRSASTNQHLGSFHHRIAVSIPLWFSMMKLAAP